MHAHQVNDNEVEGPNEDREVARSALELRSHEYANLYDFAPVPYVTLKQDGTIRHANHAAAALLGIDRDSIVGRSLGIFFTDRFKPVFSSFLEDAFKVNKKQTNEMALLVNDQLVWVTVHAIVDPERTSCLFTLQDITERKEAEKVRLEVEDRFRLMADSAPVLIWIAGTDKLCFWFNKVWLEFSGRTMEQEMGNGWAEGVHPDDLQRCLEIYTSHFDRHESFSMEYRLMRRDGEFRWLLDNGVARYDDRGEFAGYIGSCIDITDHRREQEAKEMSYLLSESQRIAHVGSWRLGFGRDTIEWSDETYCIFGVSRETFIPTPTALLDLLHPDDQQPMRQWAQSCLAGEKPDKSEFRVICPDGNVRTILGHGEVQCDPDGHPICILGMVQDITERKAAQAKLQLAASVFTHAREGIIITDAAGTMIEVNSTFTRITGYSREEAVGQSPRILKSGRQGPEFYAAMWKVLLDKGHWDGEMWNRRKSGEFYAELITISAVRDGSGKTQNYVGLFSDITPMKEHQQQLEHLAQYDRLTDLPNRMLLTDRLRQAMAQCQRRRRSLALVYLDLDGFKAINDAHGHVTGDKLLITVSQRMNAALRDGDTLARIGGDEFVVVLVDLVQPSDAEPVLERLLQAAANPVKVGDALLTVSASLGVALYPRDGLDADLLMRSADEAMYSAKQAGRNRFHWVETNRGELRAPGNDPIQG